MNTPETGEPTWNLLCQQVGIAAATGASLWLSLSVSYLAPTRFYHNLNHILNCLDIAHPYLPQTQNPLAVQLAIWFHDVIYDPRAPNNESESALFAGSNLNQAGVSWLMIQEVQRLILLTATHQAEEGDTNGCLLLDVDLAILGAAADVYQRYAQAIRQEYAWVDEASYRQGRGRVLEQFLHRKRIYQTHPLYERLEATARTNIRQELTQLHGLL